MLFLGYGRARLNLDNYLAYTLRLGPTDVPKKSEIEDVSRVPKLKVLVLILCWDIPRFEHLIVYLLVIYYPKIPSWWTPWASSFVRTLKSGWSLTLQLYKANFFLNCLLPSVRDSVFFHFVGQFWKKWTHLKVRRCASKLFRLAHRFLDFHPKTRSQARSYWDYKYDQDIYFLCFSSF